MKKIIFFILIFALFAGCRSKKNVVPAAVETLPAVQADTSSIPSFAAEALYVVAREYESIHNAETSKYHTEKAAQIRQDSVSKADYLEQRLVELYPQKAYKGVVRKIVQLAENLIPDKQPRKFDFATLEFGAIAPSDTKSALAFVSDSAEMELLNMTAAERQLYQTLNRLADSAAFVAIDKLDTLTIKDEAWRLDERVFTDSLSFFMKEDLTLPILLFGPGSYLYYRIMQSKARAYYAEKFYFPGKLNSGTRSDAYKHMLVNALLRRYTSTHLAWLVMDIYWEKTGNNAPCDNVMDLHNNTVGRTTQYSRFVTDRYDWQRWTENVYRFVQDTAQNAVHKDWNRETPLFFLRQDEQTSPDNNYLYWNE